MKCLNTWSQRPLHLLVPRLVGAVVFMGVWSCGEVLAQSPCPPFEPGDFRTQTQGGWGIAECSGSNPGCYLQAQFNAAFPEGVTLGCGDGYQWSFADAASVAAFLPQGGPASVFTFDAENPTGAAGVLSGQLLAAKLSLGFDGVDEDFGAADTALQALVFAQGPYAGWTVEALIDTADGIIGGCITTEVALSELVEALTQLNEAFVDGEGITEDLIWPGCEQDEEGEEDCNDCAQTVCTLDVNCPDAVTIGCLVAADTSVLSLGLPQVTYTCCSTEVASGLLVCDTVVPTLSWTWSDITFGSCPVTVVRTFTAQWSHADFDTTLSCTQTLLLSDTAAPVITCPPDAELGCGDAPDPDSTGWATATDACGTVVVTYSDAALELSQENAEGILRVWTATDACGNSASCEQAIALPDFTAPTIELVCPPDTQLTFDGGCNDPLELQLYGEATAAATDALDPNPTVEVAFEDEVSSPCNGQTVVERTWTATATDACGNSVMATCLQTITVTDSEAPVFVNTCGLANGEVIEVCCSSDGTATLPPPCLVTVADNCGATVVYSETATSGYAPVPGAQQACAAQQPEPFENGRTCEGDTAHALRLFCFPGSDEQVAYFTGMGVGEVQVFDDATWSLTWSVMALDNPNAGFDITAHFSEGLDWAGWNNRGIPSGFKGACADLSQAQNWMYYILDQGTLTGWGEYAGSALTLSHQPESKFYGTQVGEGANQHNADYGFGSTLTYSGDVVDNGVIVATDIQCCGDLHGEIECCLPFTVTRTYTATDCAGNTATFSYQLQSSGDPCPELEGGTADRTEALPQGRSGHIQMTGLSPNPAAGDVVLRFAVEEPLRVHATVLDMAGQKVRDLGTTDAHPDAECVVSFDVSNIPAGLYQLHLTSAGEKATQILLVAH